LERFRITSAGAFVVNGTASLASERFTVMTDVVGITVGMTAGSNDCTFMYFRNSVNGVAGSITQTGATTLTYNTSSDARLKIDQGRVSDLSALRGILIHDFTWKSDGVTDRGVFAQEAQPLYPRAITVGGDDLARDGTPASPWMVDYSKFVPDLIAGWQEHEATIADLHARLALLETA
jgi:hypothetical protein